MDHYQKLRAVFYELGIDIFEDEDSLTIIDEEKCMECQFIFDPSRKFKEVTLIPPPNEE